MRRGNAVMPATWTMAKDNPGKALSKVMPPSDGHHSLKEPESCAHGISEWHQLIQGDDTDPQAPVSAPTNEHSSQQHPFPTTSCPSLSGLNVSSDVETDSKIVAPDSCEGSFGDGLTSDETLQSRIGSDPSCCRVCIPGQRRRDVPPKSVRHLDRR